jgi:hypothetical protein
MLRMGFYMVLFGRIAGMAFLFGFSKFFQENAGVDRYQNCRILIPLTLCLIIICIIVPKNQSIRERQ